MSDDLAQRVMGVISRTLHLPPENVSLGSTFEELKMDSLDGLSLIAELENEFDVSIPNEETMVIRSVRQAVESLQRVIEGGAADASAAAQG